MQYFIDYGVVLHNITRKYIKLMRKEMTKKLLVSVALFAMASVSLLSGCSNEAIDDLTQKGSTATSGVLQLANKTSIILGIDANISSGDFSSVFSSFDSGRSLNKDC